MDPVVIPATPLQPAKPIRLSREQQRVLDMVIAGKSVFFTGPALVISGDFLQLPPVPETSHEHLFIDILSSMRTGVLSRSHIQQLTKLSRPVIYEDGIEPSQLFPLRAEVEGCNNGRLSALTGTMITYNSIDSAGESAERLLDRLVAVPKLSLKVGAQVMLIQNVIQGCLVNGSAGVLEKFLTTREAIEAGFQVAQPQQELPQHLCPFDDAVFEKDQAWPLVRFTNGMYLLCAPLGFSVEGFKGNCEAHRLQVPLILAWALSIHKSQGQTLARVKVDLNRTFEKGRLMLPFPARPQWTI
ncbi:hypothetical protein B0H13DRAFT_1868796 [Mycena leptocephala]|nr:hypothetical protein B0H13DRAFT_1868796 [Mycena leptocephala]